jgi:adenine-specific DNA-methyltransferase
MPIKSKYSDWSKEDLIKRVEALEKRKKYGLVWDEERTKEKFEADAEGKLPVLKEVKSKEIKTDPEKPTHILIEGDNYHALSVLSYTHEKAVDAIYIDPPYNTGAKDWKYNNNYVGDDDAYRHSKWLSFMHNRLLLSKKLLKNDGIICVTIDDYEMPRLFMLMEEIFGEKNRLGTIVIRNNPSGRSTLKGISITHEYALIFGRSGTSKVGRLPRNEKQINRYDEKDDKSAFEWVNFRKHGGTREESPKMFYPFYLTDNSWRIPKMEWNKTDKKWKVCDKPKKEEVIVYPIDENGKERRWKWSYSAVLNSPEDFKVGRDRRNELAMYIKSRLSEEGVLPLTWWDKKEYSATAYGTNLLKDIFSEIQVFSYPKSLFAVIDCIRAITTNKNAVILDFFAGSGTTGHAIMKLNDEDDGQRQFILCTNNENNICTDVCYPRVKKIIEGYKNLKGENIDGLGGNLKYFKTSFVPSEPTDKNKELLTKESVEMLCLRESTFDFVSETDTYKIFKNNEHYTGIIFDQLSIAKFKKEASKLDKPISVYVFSLGDDDFSAEFADMKKKIKVCSIPEAILRVYRRIFK